MKITACKINHLTEPLGYELSSPRISWKVEDALGTRAAWSRVRVASDPGMTDILYDSGEADLSSLATPLPVECAPRTAYYWTVEVESDAGERAISGVNRFETGKMLEPWSGQWITAPRRADGRHPVFVRRIPGSVSPIRQARLYITGLGLFEAAIDGQRVGEELLTPYCNHYDEWVQGFTFDVTELLAESGSELTVAVGRGWYSGRFGLDPKYQDGVYGHEDLLLAELRISYEDGSQAVIGTDGDWMVRRSTIYAANFYDGEYRDDTLLELPEEKALLEGELAPAVPVVDRYSLPVTVFQRFEAVRVENPAGDLLLDLGQNISGIFELKIREVQGTKIHIQTGEVLQDGNFYNENLRTAKAEYIYVTDGEEKVLRPRFTFYGYRYVRITGLTDYQDGDFTGLSITTQLDRAGELTTGNAKVDRLVKNVQWGNWDNFVDVPTDCPQRDERMGWTGDTQVFSATALYLQDSYPFYRKFLHDLEMEQRSRRGCVPNTIPNFRENLEGEGGFHGSAVWADAATIVPMNVYRFSGDATILREQFDSMKAWVDYIHMVDGDDMSYRQNFTFGDWLALDQLDAVDSVLGATDGAFINDVYYMYSAELTAEAARILSKDTAVVRDAAEREMYAAQADKYDALAGTIRQRIKDEFYSATGRCAIDTQTGILLTLEHGLAPTKKAVSQLARKMDRTGGKLNCGFTGAPLLCRVLHEFGMEDRAMKLLMNEEYPGWLYEVNLGATTIWERWNSLDAEGHISSTGMNSLNHYAYGSVAEYMFRDLAGLKPTAPGFKSVECRPYLTAELPDLRCSYDSAAGRYAVDACCGCGDRAHVSLSVPFGAVMRFVIPEGWRAEEETTGLLAQRDPAYAEGVKGVAAVELTSGDYRFELIREVSDAEG